MFCFFFSTGNQSQLFFGSQNTFVTNLDKQRNLFCVPQKAKDDDDDDDDIVWQMRRVLFIINYSLILLWQNGILLNESKKAKKKWGLNFKNNLLQNVTNSTTNFLFTWLIICMMKGITLNTQDNDEVWFNERRLEYSLWILNT